MIREIRNDYKIMFVNHEGKRSFERLRHFWDGDNATTNITEIRCEIDWV